MDRMDALPILERIIRHWGARLSSGQHDHWMDTLETLDAGVAGTTYVRLQQKTDKLPSPAEFLAEYRTVAPYDATHRAPQCEACCNTGLVTDTDHPRHWPGPPDSMPRPVGPDGDVYCDCNVATWCRGCEHGKRARAMLQRMAGTDQAAVA